VLVGEYTETEEVEVGCAPGYRLSIDHTYGQIRCMEHGDWARNLTCDLIQNSGKTNI